MQLHLAVLKFRKGLVLSTPQVPEVCETEKTVDAPETGVPGWASVLAEEASSSACLTVGLTTGSRMPSDRRTIEALVSDVAGELMRLDSSSRMLWLRLEATEDARILKSSTVSAERIPLAQRSPIGPWSEVCVPIAKSGHPGGVASAMSEWLPVWKQSFRLIVIELGAIHWFASRSVGRLCDGCYLLLGPTGCACQEWVMQHIAWHHQSGSTICGTLVASVRSAA